MVKILDRIKNPQDVQGSTLYLAQIITLYLGLVDNDHCTTLHFRWVKAAVSEPCSVCTGHIGELGAYITVLV